MAIGDPTKIKGDWPTRNAAHAAHGIIISVAIVLWFPLGVLILRILKLPRTVTFHAIWQCIGLFLLLVGFGLGVWLSDLQGGLTKQGHVILGIIITLLFLLLPIFGYLHHKHFAKVNAKNYKGHVHVWLGRVLLVLGVINGGTGLKLSDNTTGGGIAYGVVAGLAAVAYLGVWWWSKKQRKEEIKKNEARGEAMEMP